MLIGAMNNPKEDVVSQVMIIAESGYDYVELTLEPPGASRDRVLEVLKQIKDEASKMTGGLLIGHTAWYMPIVIPYEEVRKKSLEEFRKDFEVFNKIESIGKVVVHTSFSPGYENEESMLETLLDSILYLKDQAESYGLELLLENDPVSPFWNYERIVKASGVKMCLDLGHAFVVKSLRSALLLAYRSKKLEHLHAHDNKGSKDEHLPIGAGKIPWDFVVAVLKAMGYNKTITIEDHSQRNDLRGFSKEVLKKMFNEVEVGSLWELLPVGP